MADGFSFWFQSEYLDRETGLYYWKHRYYEPPLGRWLSRDPIGERGGINLYNFVFNNPVGLWDPDGRKVQICCRNIDVNPIANCLAKLCGKKHCWLSTDTKKAGMGPATSDDLPSSPCCGTKIAIKDHSKDKSTVCYDIPEANEDCVNKELVIGKSLGEWKASNNCNSFVANTLKKCGGKNKCKKWITILPEDYPSVPITLCQEWTAPTDVFPPNSP